jgi:phage protein D
VGDTWVWVPAFQVTVNGQDLDQKDEAKPVEVVYNDNVDAADFFSVRLGLVDNATGKADWIDDGLYKEGGKVRIKMGHEGRAVKTMIEGEITGVEVLFSSRGPETLVLQGYDRHHRLRRGRKSRTFQNMTDSDIAQKIAGDQGLTLRGDTTSVRYEHVYQNNLSDFDFLRQRAARIGYEVEIENTNLYFRKSQEARSKVITLKWGEPGDDELISFAPRLSTANQVSEVTVRGWNPKEKKEIVGRAKVGDETTRMAGSVSGGQSATSAFGTATTVVVDHPIFDQREADALAKARFNELSLGYIGGEGVCIGNPDIRAGEVIEVKGFGRRFSGLYYVVSSNHVCGRGGGGYRTEFSVRRNTGG